MVLSVFFHVLLIMASRVPSVQMTDNLLHQVVFRFRYNLCYKIHRDHSPRRILLTLPYQDLPEESHCGLLYRWRNRLPMLPGSYESPHNHFVPRAVVIPRVFHRFLSSRYKYSLHINMSKDYVLHIRSFHYGTQPLPVLLRKNLSLLPKLPCGRFFSRVLYTIPEILDW